MTGKNRVLAFTMIYSLLTYVPSARIFNALGDVNSLHCILLALVIGSLYNFISRFHVAPNNGGKWLYGKYKR